MAHAALTAICQHSFCIPRPNLTQKLGTLNACNQWHVDKSTQWAVDYVNKWHGCRKSQYGIAFKEGFDGLFIFIMMMCTLKLFGQQYSLIRNALSERKQGNFIRSFEQF
jgi:hypothetical protein